VTVSDFQIQLPISEANPLALKDGVLHGPHVSGTEEQEGDADFVLTRTRGQELAKRAMDVALVLSLGLVLLPFLAVFSLATKASSPGPVLFKHLRIGRDGRPFYVLKFRTMHRDAEKRLERDPELYAEYLKNNYKLPRRDPRMTSVGRHLRKSSLDELPQLWNVLTGQMSLVGPRPVVPEELACYGALAPAYMAVRPGMTGAWQVHGRSRVGYPERAYIDYDYVTNWSLLRDGKLLLQTIPAVTFSRGRAY